MRIRRTHSPRLVAAASVAASLLFAACGGVAASGSTGNTTSAAVASSSNIKVGLKKATWGKNMTVTYGTNTIRLR